MQPSKVAYAVASTCEEAKCLHSDLIFCLSDLTLKRGAVVMHATPLPLRLR